MITESHQKKRNPKKVSTKGADDAIEDEIASSFTLHCLHSIILAIILSIIGEFNIDMEKLSDPPDYLRIRDVKELYMNFIAEGLKDEENDHEELTSPLLVIASVNKSEFRDKNISKYTYQVCLKIAMLVH